MKVSPSLLNKQKPQLDFLFSLSWTLEFRDVDGKALLRTRVKFKLDQTDYITYPKKEVVILSGTPTNCTISRGRYKLECSAGPAGEISTPEKFEKGQIFLLESLTIHITPKK
jgi:hypothetical protein